MPLPITALYTALTMFIVLALALRVTGYRRLQGIALGDGGREELQRRRAAHSNLTENAPLILIGLGLLEWQGTWPLFLHGIGLFWIAARIAHPIGLERKYPNLPLRSGGTAITFWLYLSMGMLLLWNVVSQYLHG